GEVDLELARKALRVRVTEQPARRRLGPRCDVELLLRACAREVATHHVADGVAAGLARGEPDRCHEPQDLGRALELDEVELDVLARGEVAPAARVRLGDVREGLELLRGHSAVRHLHAQHLVVAALTLAVDALVEPEHPEHVLVDAPVEVFLDGALERVELLGDHRVEGSVGQLAYVDRHRAAPGSGTEESCWSGGEGWGAGAQRFHARHISSRTSWQVRPIEMLGAPRNWITNRRVDQFGPKYQRRGQEYR